MSELKLNQTPMNRAEVSSLVRGNKLSFGRGETQPTPTDGISPNRTDEMSSTRTDEISPNRMNEMSVNRPVEMPPRCRELHTRALAVVGRYRTAEIELLQILEEVERERVHLRFGCHSLFQYAVKCLGLSENIAYTFIYVARKAREVPELKREIAKGALSVSKAKKITGVITRENSAQWIALAQSASQQKLEREVALANPREGGRGRMNYVHPQKEITEKIVVTSAPEVGARVQVQVGISERLMIKIRRVQEIQSQKARRSVGLEETLETLVNHYLAKCDPLEVAKRQLLRGKLSHAPKADESLGVEGGVALSETLSGAAHSTAGPTAQSTAGPRVRSTAESAAKSAAESPSQSTAEKVGNQQVLRLVAEMGASDRMPTPTPTPSSASSLAETTARARSRIGRRGRENRRPLPAAIKHRVYLKFQARCSHVDSRGERCRETKFLEIHHLKPIRLGGSDRFENLTLLCSGHHQGIHL